MMWSWCLWRGWRFRSSEEQPTSMRGSWVTKSENMQSGPAPEIPPAIMARLLRTSLSDSLLLIRSLTQLTHTFSWNWMIIILNGDFVRRESMRLIDRLLCGIGSIPMYNEKARLLRRLVETFPNSEGLFCSKLQTLNHFV